MTVKQNFNKIYVFSAPTTAALLFKANPKRKAFSIHNVGANIVEFLDHEGIYGNGYPLAVGDDIDDDHFNPQDELWVIATTAASELRVWEIIASI